MYDYCVVGSGASGAVATNYLVNLGFQVLLLEAGDLVTQELHNEDIDSHTDKCYTVNSTNQIKKDGWPWTSSNLGGGTVFYGAASFRYLPEDFNCNGVLKDATGQRIIWPFSYEEILPYYERMEEELNIAGGEDFFLKKNEYYKVSSQAKLIGEASRRLGYKPITTPLAIKFGIESDSCNMSQVCIANRKCETGAKSDSYSTFLKPNLFKSNLDIVTNVKALKLVEDVKGRISEITCICLETNIRRSYKAKRFLLACNAIQSAALLLRSKSKWSKNGVGNNFNLVGKYLSMKASHYVYGIVKKTSQLENIDYLGPFSTIALTDNCYSDKFPSGIGGLIYEAKPDIVDNVKVDNNEMVIRLECIIADTPNINNQVDLFNDDILIEYKLTNSDKERLEALMELAKDLLLEVGIDTIYDESSGFEKGSAHLHGTCRYGETPDKGVLDKECKVYGVDNLWVIDGSFMPYPSSFNPTLTIQANALRVVEAIITKDKELL